MFEALLYSSLKYIPKYFIWEITNTDILLKWLKNWFAKLHWEKTHQNMKNTVLYIYITYAFYKR